MALEFTSKARVIRNGEFYWCTFFCDLCDYGYSAEPVAAESPGGAIRKAREQARRHFNLCHRCKKWVCDRHYNEDVMLCVECEPKNRNRENV